MPVVDVKNLEGKTVGTMELAGDVFAVKVNPHLLHETVRHYLAGQRAGTHKTKDKSEVSGSGKKLWKQKGTGRARIGSIRSPLWRHGGTVHGPVPRSYAYALPKKMILGALRSAIAAKINDGKLTIVENFDVEVAKTKVYRDALNKLDAKKTALLVESSQQLSEKLYLGSRNLQGVELVLSSEVHPYDLLKYENAIFSKAAFETLTETLKKAVSKRQHAEKEAA